MAILHRSGVSVANGRQLTAWGFSTGGERLSGEWPIAHSMGIFHRGGVSLAEWPIAHSKGFSKGGCLSGEWPIAHSMENLHRGGAPMFDF